MTVKKHTPSGAQSSTSARAENHTAKSARQKGKAAAIDPRDLPALISAVMRHPDTPTLIYNTLGESICEMSNDIDHHSPEMIRTTLAAHAEREAKRKGGAE